MTSAKSVLPSNTSTKSVSTNNTSSKISCFKAYDIRGKLGTELNVDVAYRIGRAFSEHTKAKTVVIGGDIRLTSNELKLALAKGLMAGGTDVIDLGLAGTEYIYFATSFLKCDGGIVVTASHNPIDYNGMKLVRENSKPISGDTGLFDIQALAENNNFIDLATPGTLTTFDISAAYTEHLLTYIATEQITPLKLVVNAGNGAAGPALDAIEMHLRCLMFLLSLLKCIMSLMVISQTVYLTLY